MFNNFILSYNAIVPIFLLVLIGVLLKKAKVVDEHFASKATNLVFKVCLPAMLFKDIATINIIEKFDTRLVLFSVCATIILFIAGIVCSVVIADPSRRAAFAQGVFRSNYAILGVPLTKAIFPPEIAVNASVLLAVTVPFYNVLSVVLLTSLLEKKRNPKAILLGIMKNPLIIGAISGTAFSLLHISLPVIIMKPMGYLSDMCTPLSLIVIGASFTWSSAKETFKPAFIASISKTFISPLIFMPIAIVLGIEGDALGVLFIFLASPAAVSSYTMIRNMGGNYHMAGNIVLLSTALSFFAIFLGIMTLKYFWLC